MKWAIREAIDVYFKAKSPLKLGARTIRAGEPIMIFDTVQTSTLEVAAEISYVTGGRGNARILSFEGDKTLTFNFEDALLSNEGLAILAGADLIPARNSRLPGSSPDAKSVTAHYTEKFAVSAGNIADGDVTNQFPDDRTLIAKNGGDLSPRGGPLNVWLSKKPFIGQNGSVYVMLLDDAGEMSGSPLEINLRNPDRPFGRAQDEAGDRPGEWIDWDGVNRRSHLAKWAAGDFFIAVDNNGNPMRVRRPQPNSPVFPNPVNREASAVFDDQVNHYVDVASMAAQWLSSWGDIRDYIRFINAPAFGTAWGEPNLFPNPGSGNGFRNITMADAGAALVDEDGEPTGQIAVAGHDGQPVTFNQAPILITELATVSERVGSYGYLLAPSGSIGQPKAFREGSSYVYKVNVPSVLFQDIVLIDYYVEHRRGATQVSILPDKFGPFVYVEGSSLVRRASDGKDLPAEFVIPKFKITTQLTFTMASTGDASTFNFAGDAYPDFSKFDRTRRVLADIQIIDESLTETAADPTDYRRYHNTNADVEYLWKDPSMEAHSNIDMADTGTYQPDEGGPATLTPGAGAISVNEQLQSMGNRINTPPGADIMNDMTTPQPRNAVNIYWPKDLAAVEGETVQEVLERRPGGNQNVTPAGETIALATPGIFQWINEDKQVGRLGSQLHFLIFIPYALDDEGNPTSELADEYQTLPRAIPISVTAAPDPGAPGPQAPTVNWPTALEGFVGETLGDLDLPSNTGTPGTFSWVVPTTTTLTLGVNGPFQLRFVPLDTAAFQVAYGEVTVQGVED